LTSQELLGPRSVVRRPTRSRTDVAHEMSKSPARAGVDRDLRLGREQYRTRPGSHR
jgi:hypothetical protein